MFRVLLFISIPLAGRVFQFEIFGIDLGVVVPLIRDGFFSENSFNRAFRFTGTAIDAFVGVDVEHLAIRLVVSVRRMDTVDGADFYAGSIAGPDARLSDDIGHE